MNTRRHPRTLVEAFGPYANDGPFIEPQDPMPKADRFVVIASLVGFVVVGMFALVGWL